MVTASNISTQTIWKILEQVPDPEVPVLTIADLGIIRDVKLNGDEVEVIITPTYTGCPAMDMIAMNIRMALIENGYSKIKITSIFLFLLTQQIPDSSVNLAALPVKHYTNATIVKSLLIFLNAIKMASPFSG